LNGYERRNDFDQYCDNLFGCHGLELFATGGETDISQANMAYGRRHFCGGQSPAATFRTIEPSVIAINW
jgi:hypothetical protein